MTDKKIKQKIQEQVRKEIVQQVNDKQTQVQEGVKTNYRQLEESAIAVFGSIAAASAGYFGLRRWLQKTDYENTFNAFFESEDDKNVVNKTIPEILRKFKLVSSLSDLKEIETQVDQAVKELEQLQNRVDRFIDASVRQEKSFLDKAFMINPEQEKARFKRELNRAVKEIRKTFEFKVNEKREELLGE